RRMVSPVHDGPVDREPTAHLIARRLRTAITHGSLAPPRHLGEAALAAQLRVSRRPLREAMQRLVTEGLLYGARHRGLYGERQRGLFVIDPGPDDVCDIHTARIAIERTALRTIPRASRESAASELDAVAETMAGSPRSTDPPTSPRRRTWYPSTLRYPVNHPRGPALTACRRRKGRRRSTPHPCSARPYPRRAFRRPADPVAGSSCTRNSPDRIRCRWHGPAPPPRYRIPRSARRDQKSPRSSPVPLPAPL